MSDFVYDIRWSDRLDEKFITDYLSLQNEVFHCGSRDRFDLQFVNNIYGNSILVVVYLGDEPVAARALWRNDINGQESYQPGSTCVKAVCRGRGIFTEMTKRAVSELPEGVIVYNYPNYNSFPGYMKMGWCIAGKYKSRLYTSYTEFKKEHLVPIDNEYVKWWLIGTELKYKKICGRYFLVQKDRRPFCYHILGETDEQSALLFPKLSFGLIFYKSRKETWYNNKLGSSCVVTKNLDINFIPTWKIDAV